LDRAAVKKSTRLWYLASLASLEFVFLMAAELDARANEFQPLFRGARAQAMGNAFTAVADDELAVFFNPAGLAGVQKISINITTVTADVSNDIISNYSTLSSTLGNLSNLSDLNNLIGKNIYARTLGSFSLVMPKFAIVGFGDEQIGLSLNNQASPQGFYGAQTTYGAQTGFGFTILKLKRKKGELRFGVSGKMLWRAGGFQYPTLNTLMTLNTGTFTSNLTNFGLGFGVDTGMQFIYHFGKKFTVSAGVAYKDIGNTAFVSGADPQKSDLTGGIAGTFKSSDIALTLAYDYGHILDYADWRRKSHLGLELKFPVISLYGGLNEIYPCFGAGLDIGIVKIMYVNYVEELASVVGINPEGRQMVQFTFKFDL
jgi:hypothetical protein